MSLRAGSTEIGSPDPARAARKEHASTKAVTIMRFARTGRGMEHRVNCRRSCWLGEIYENDYTSPEGVPLSVYVLERRECRGAERQLPELRARGPERAWGAA